MLLFWGLPALILFPRIDSVFLIFYLLGFFCMLVRFMSTFIMVPVLCVCV